ncbi:TPA: DHH family phosphoesterase [Candidatus Woesearchaeota archaeon]|nr:DHH family phosphoesterase [Candidatus Woesearchaeota archaeon]
MLTQKQVQFLREELQTAQNPLFIHDGDGDGLCSFLLLYRINREGKNFIFKAAPKLDASFLEKMKGYHADKVFILDIPMVDQEFIDGLKRPVFWIDHHEPQKRDNVHYFNPRINNPDAYIPTTYMAYQISQKKEDLWLATAGCFADYMDPDFLPEFIERYPQYLKKHEALPTMIFKRPISKLVKLFFFLLKGPTSEIRKSVKVLTRIEHPDEIFKETTSQGKFLHKRFEKINAKYQELLTLARKQVTRSKVFVFYYTDTHWSFTANIANELTALYPKKVVIIAREKSGEMKCSLRAQFPIVTALKKALEGVEGYGGGHPNACGAVIKKEDFEQFLTVFKKELKK